MDETTPWAGVPTRLFVDWPEDRVVQAEVVASVLGLPAGREAVGSAVFELGDELVTATVGSMLPDGSIVLAIFAGVPLLVVTDARPFSARPTLYTNPLPVLLPLAVEHPAATVPAPA